MYTHCEECEFDCAGSVVVMTVDDVKTVTAQTSQYPTITNCQKSVSSVR